MLMSALYQTNTFRWILIVLAHALKQQSAARHFALFVALFRLQANQSLFLFLSAACLVEEAANTNSIVFGLIRPGLEPTFYHIRGEQSQHSNHYVYTLQMRGILNMKHNAGFRTNETLCQLSYEAPYLGPEGDRPVDYQLCHYVWNRSETTPSNLKLHHINQNPS